MEQKTEKTYLKLIIEDQMERHAGFRIQDLYKMLHQSTCGVKHLLGDEAQAKKVLLSEWETLDKIQKGEALLEVIDPVGEAIRVNLRVLRKIKKNPLGLFEMMKRSADHFQNDEQRLVRYWETIMEWSDERIIPFAKDDVEDFWIDVGRRGFPAVHHSESYTVANRPAYRVVLKSFLEGFTSYEAT